MTYKQLETIREIRMWTKEIIVPTAMAVVAVMTVPEAREAVAAKANQVKESIKSKTRKIKSLH